MKVSGSLAVNAEDDSSLLTVSAGAAGGQGAAVGVPLAIGVLNKTTSALIDADAVVTANGLGSIRTLNGQIAPRLAFATGGVAGNAITIANHGLSTGDEVFYSATSPLDGLKTDRSYFVIRVDANTVRLADTLELAKAGTALAVSAVGNSGKDHALARRLKSSEGEALGFADSDVNFASGQITIANHGLSSGDQVTYTSEQRLDGLKTGDVLYVRVIDDKTIALYRDRNAAIDGKVNGVLAAPIALKDLDRTTTALHTLTPQRGQAVSEISTQKYSDKTLAADGTVGAGTGDHRGIAVVALSTNSVKIAGAGAAFAAGGAAGTIAGAVTVQTINTTAEIRSGATVSTKNAEQGSNRPSLLVAANRSTDTLAIGAGLAGTTGSAGGAVGFSGGGLYGGTYARIAGDKSSDANSSLSRIDATRDVIVQANAREKLVAAVVGAGAASGYGVGGSAGVFVMDTKTTAEITGLVAVNAGGNVRVEASDDTTARMGAGAAGFGSSAGLGGAFNVIQITKSTLAQIDDQAEVTSGAGDLVDIADASDPTGRTTRNASGVIVTARSSEAILNVAVAAGGGAVGISGSVAFSAIDSDTTARIRGGAKITADGPGADVAVVATNRADVVSVAGGIAGGGLGLAGGVTIVSLANDANAEIDQATISARDDVIVTALSDWDIDSYSIAGSGGAGALAGGVTVINVGGNFNDGYNNAGAGNASASQGVLQQIGAQATGLTSALGSSGNSTRKKKKTRAPRPVRRPEQARSVACLPLVPSERAEPTLPLRRARASRRATSK